MCAEIILCKNKYVHRRTENFRTDGKISDGRKIFGRTDGKFSDGRTDGRTEKFWTDGRKKFGRTDGRTDGRMKKKKKKSKCVSDDRSRRDDSESGRIIKIGAILKG